MYIGHVRANYPDLTHAEPPSFCVHCLFVDFYSLVVRPCRDLGGYRSRSINCCMSSGAGYAVIDVRRISGRARRFVNLVSTALLTKGKDPKCKIRYESTYGRRRRGLVVDHYMRSDPVCWWHTMSARLLMKTRCLCWTAVGQSWRTTSANR